MKNANVIPKGIYCYDENGKCPYWSKNPDHHEQENGYCSFLERGDWEVEIPDDFPNFPTSFLSLLWDSVKECSINMDEENDI